MKRTILAGALFAFGAAGLLAQPTTAPPQGQAAPPQGQAAPAQAAPAQTGPRPKTQAEVTGLQALQAAAQANDPDAVIKAAEDFNTKFTDSDFKDMVLCTEAGAYQQKRDWIHAQIFAEQALAANPKSYQANLILADVLSQHTGEHDLDRDDKLAKADKYAHAAIEELTNGPKPNAAIPDAQWEEYKKPLIGQAQHDIGLSNTTRKSWDAAIVAFKAAVDADPQPAYKIQMANAMQQAGKNDEAIAVCDQVLAEPNLHPQIAAVAKSIKAQATAAKEKK